MTINTSDMMYKLVCVCGGVSVASLSTLRSDLLR